MLPDIFFFDTKIGQVTSVNDKIDRVPLVDMLHEVIRFIQPALGVACKDKTDGVFILAGVPDFKNIRFIDIFIFFVRDSSVIRMVIYQITRCE